MGGFKDFIMKGNVLDLAVGVIMAGAFGAIVSSFTNDVIMPPIGTLLGGVNFSDLGYVLQPAELAADGSVAKEAVKIGWGNFIQKVLDFLIIAFVIFQVVKAYDRATNKQEEVAGPTQEELLTEIRDSLRNP